MLFVCPDPGMKYEGHEDFLPTWIGGESVCVCVCVYAKFYAIRPASMCVLSFATMPGRLSSIPGKLLYTRQVTVYQAA